MDLSTLLNTQYGFHAAAVGGVIICALLVYLLGFKSVEEPHFDKLSDDRKPAGKKRKVKDKKGGSQVNGHAVGLHNEGGGGKKQQDAKGKKEERKETSPHRQQQQSKNQVKKVNAVAAAAAPLKEIKDTNDNKKSEKNKNKPKGKENLLLKNKKNIETGPEDDDGEWEQAVSRRDKRSKKVALEEILPQKNEKKKDKKKVDEDEINDSIPDTKILDELTEIGIDAEAAVEVAATAPAPQAAVAGGGGTSLTTTPKEQRKSSKKKKAPPAPDHHQPPAKHQPDAAVKQQVVEADPPKEVAPSAKQNKAAGDAPQKSVNPPPPVIKEEKVKEESKQEPVSEGANIVFDELGDSWKEAKTAKKNTRKKTRVD